MIVTYFAKSASRFLQESWGMMNVLKYKEPLTYCHMSWEQAGQQYGLECKALENQQEKNLERKH